MLVIIDAGHGKNTPGKKSPDGQFLEYKYCRELANILTNKLIDNDFAVVNLMLGIEEDQSLRERCKRINNIVAKEKDCIVVSLHVNAAGNGKKWMQARGWSVFVSQNASIKSKFLATQLAQSAREAELYKVRIPMKGLDYWVQDLAICRDTKCPAVLVENLFMDNLEDLAFLQTDESKELLTNIILNGIIKYRIDLES